MSGSFRTVGGRFRYRISLPYRKSLFFTPNASENASRTPGSHFEHGTHIPYRRRPSPVPNASDNASRTPGSLFEHRMRIPYRRRPSPVPNASDNASRAPGGRFRYRVLTQRQGPVGKTGQEKQGSCGNPVCRITQKDYTKGTPNRAHGTIKRKRSTVKVDLLWELRESNPRPSACKADALNQLS